MPQIISSLTLISDPTQAEDIAVHNRTVNSFCIEWTQDGVVDNYVLNITDTNTPVVTVDVDDRNACVQNLSTAGKEYTFTLTAVSGGLENAAVSQARTGKITLSYGQGHTWRSQI